MATWQHRDHRPGAMSVTLTPTPTTAATCAPPPAPAPRRTARSAFRSPASHQVAVAFAGTPTVVGDSVYISVINAPIPPTVTIVSPLNTDVFGTTAQIPVQVQINYANNNNNSVLYFASGAFNQSNTIAGLGQTVSSGAALFNLNPSGFNNAQPTVESLIIVATDGTTGASTTKTVSFTIDIFKNISPQLGRPTAVKVTQSTFVAATALLAPMGLSILPATNTLYIADSGTSTVFASSLAGPFPVAAGNLTAVKNNLNGVSDAQLQPDAGSRSACHLPGHLCRQRRQRQLRQGRCCWCRDQPADRDAADRHSQRRLSSQQHARRDDHRAAPVCHPAGRWPR